MRESIENLSKFTLRARWVLPIDRPPIAGGYVSVVGGCIVEVGAGKPDGSAGSLTDLGDAVLLPGLVNAHTHLEFSGLSAPLGVPGMSLPAWIRQVIADRHRKDRDPAASIAAGLAESLAAGVTSIGEIATASRTGYAAVGPQPGLVLFQEAIGFSAGRVDSAFVDVQRRFDDAALGVSIEVNEPTCIAGLSPHAPYTVHPRLLEKVLELAIDRAAPVAMHLAESREELELLATGGGPFRELLLERSMWDETSIPRDARPLDYLHALAEAPRALVVHGNYLTAAEIDFLAQRRDRMSVAYCPRTHAYFGHERYPLEAMLAAGVRVALGTDSRASNPDLSLLGELRFVSARHPAIDPATFVRLATLDGATALGFGAQTGSLLPGKQADLLALACSAADPHACLVSGNGAPLAVWLAGRRVR